MTILEQTKEFYDQLGCSMFADISAYAARGYVHITPQLLILGKTVRTDIDVHPDDQWNVVAPDAWYVRTAVGGNAISEFINLIPHPLPYVGWMRQLKQKPVKWYEFNRINRRK